MHGSCEESEISGKGAIRMGSALSIRFCQRHFGLWAGMRRLTTGPSRGCVRPRGDPPSDNGNEADGVFAGGFAGPLVRGPSQGICKATQDECGRRYSADPSHVLQTTDTNILIRTRSAARHKNTFRETFDAAAEPGTPAPVSLLGPQATSIKTRLRIRFLASGHLPKNRSEKRSAPPL